MAARTSFSLVAIVILMLLQSAPTRSEDSMTEYFYHSCESTLFLPGSTLEASLSSLLTAMTKAAQHWSYNYSTGWTQWSALFQCRRDLSRRDCAACVDSSVSQLRDFCPRKTGGSIQLAGCYFRYDTTPFIGGPDKSVIYESCGPSGGPTAVDSTRDMVLEWLREAVGLYSRTDSSLDVSAMAQCLGDLNPDMCQDCIVDAIGWLQSKCSGAVSGDMFLRKCYARFTSTTSHAGARLHPIITYWCWSLFMLLMVI